MFLKLFVVLLFIIPSAILAQEFKYNPEKIFTVVFYNVENLFDIKNDPVFADEDFMPEGKYNWTADRYNKKLKNISKVLGSINTNELPEIIGLCEVENRAVLEDLIKQPDLASGNYEIIHENSKDVNGKDVALLFRKDEFKYLSHKAIPANFAINNSLKTRDILYVKGIASNTDTLHFFINHWPSRTGGIQETEANRIFCSMLLRHHVDSILRKIPKSKVIIMGDFNDEPTNKSLHSILQASNKRRNISYLDLYNLMFDTHNILNNGTFYYQGFMLMLDNIIVSQALLLDKKGYKTAYNSGQVFSAEWILTKDTEKGKLKPKSTFGNEYQDGFSDHLPVFVILKK